MTNGYSICLNEWIEDTRIKTELRLLLKISSLTAERGYCFASNPYFAEYFNTSEVTISKQIKKLEKLGYLEIEYQKRGAEVTRRFLRLKKTLTDDYQKLKPTIKENFKDNNISIKIKSNNRFTPPTIEEIREYVSSKNLNLDVEYFYEYFNESNWVDSKGNKVANWKQKILTWSRFNNNSNNQSNSSTSGAYGGYSL